MSVGIQITYDSLVFNSGTPDVDGTQWYADKYDGWDSPSTKVSASSPTTRHGQVLNRVLFDARALVFGGTVKALDVPNFYKAFYGIDQVFNNLITPKQFTVAEDVDRYVSACRTGQVRKTLQGGCAFTFEINLSCPDPLKYGASVSTVIASGASATINNPGSFASEQIILTSGAGAVSVVNETVGGRGIVTDQNVTAGTVFDFYERSVLDAASNDVYDSLAPYSDWFTIQPGDNTVTNHSAASVTLAFLPTWL
jgi:phage-related protein